MIDGHQIWRRDAPLRGLGAGLLACGWLVLRWLFRSAALAQHHAPTLGAFAAAALGFTCLSAGTALATLGAHLLDQVELSERWVRRR